MVEVHTGGPEPKQQKSSFNAAETARENRQAEQEPQVRGPVIPPSSPEEREERYTAERQQRRREEPTQIEEHPNDGQEQQQAAWTPEEDELFNEILYGKSTRESTRAKASKRIEKLAAENGWEAVADTLWRRMAEFETEYAKKYDATEAKQRKLPDQADTREQIDERLSRIHAKPLADNQWEEWQRIRQIDPATLTEEEWREWKRNPASMSQEAVGDIEEYLQEIAPAKEWLDRFQKEEQQMRWEQIAVPSFAERLGIDPSILTPEERKKLASYDPESFNRTQWFGLDPLTLTAEQQKELADYNPLKLQYAEHLGLNPLTLTPEEREDIAWGDVICERAKKLGLDPRTLTADERYDLRRRGRILTPEERKEREEWEKEHAIQPLTDEERSQLILKMHANVQAMQRKKAAWLHERDPRYDPMTGDLLEPDEHPLDPTAAYYFAGATRPRRFVPGDSPHLDKYKEVQIDEADVQPEGEYNERLVNRLLKAGFVEVEPTLADKASFEQTQWYRSLSPSEKMQFLRESMQEMTRSRSFDKETAGGKIAKTIGELIELMIDFLIALIKPETIEETDQHNPAKKAA